jgi:potassium channel subfamily K
MAPLSTLLDIPALTQHWYSFGEADVDDATTSLVLSAVGLGFNVLANILLVVRFSASKHWRIASHVSLVAWLIKVRH